MHIFRNSLQIDHQRMLLVDFDNLFWFKNGYNDEIADTIRTCGYDREIIDTIRTKVFMHVHFQIL